MYIIWLVVSTHLNNISQNGNLPQIGVNIKNIWNHHLVIQWIAEGSKFGNIHNFQTGSDWVQDMA